MMLMMAETTAAAKKHNNNNDNIKIFLSLLVHPTCDTVILNSQKAIVFISNDIEVQNEFVDFRI